MAWGVLGMMGARPCQLPGSVWLRIRFRAEGRNWAFAWRWARGGQRCCAGARGTGAGGRVRSGDGTGDSGRPGLSNIVYQATPRDPVVLAGVVVAMALLGLVATSIPAQRALLLDPLLLLREE